MNIKRLLEATRNGAVDAWAASVLWKSAPSPPPAPDYTGAATATAAGNKENTIAAQQGSMVNQTTPYGGINYQQTGTWEGTDNPRYTANTTLSPLAQDTLDQQLKASQGLGHLATDTLRRTEQAYQQPFDYSSVGDVQNQAYQAQTARLDPQWQARDTQQETKLINQGLRPGGEAYTNAMRDYNNARNDAYSQARLNAINTMPQTYQLASALREQPLNELNAIRTGAQVQNPQFQQTPGQQYTPGPNYLGAATSQYGGAMNNYNAEVGQANAFNSGLFGLGAAALGAPAGTFSWMSDIRLKSNIIRVGTHPLGVGIYEYDIFGHRERGVMAQEVLKVKPSAVLMTDSGFYAVNYGAL